jgi:hypothetical protein
MADYNHSGLFKFKRANQSPVASPALANSTQQTSIDTLANKGEVHD